MGDGCFLRPSVGCLRSRRCDTARFAPAGGKLTGTMLLDPAGNPTDLGLVYDALIKSIARHRPLRPILSRGGHAVVVRPPDENLRSDIAQEHRKLLNELRKAYSASLTGSVPRIGCSFAEAIRVRIEVWDGRWWLVYEPIHVGRTAEGGRSRITTRRSPPIRSIIPDESDPRFIAADWRRERWAQRYNKTWHNVIAAWAKLIAPGEETDLSAQHFEGSGINAEFRLSWTTAWSSPVSVKAPSKS